MAKWRVYGEVNVGVTITVEADSEEAAIDAAYEEFDGLSGYAGNGGSGKLVGTTCSNAYLSPDGEVEFTETEPA